MAARVETPVRFKELVRGVIRRCGRSTPGLVRSSLRLLSGWPRLQVFVARSAGLSDAVAGTIFRIDRGPLAGTRFTGLLADEIGPILANAMELRCSEIVSGFRSSNGVMLDVGGLYGYYAVLMSLTAGPQGAVYTFEPDWRSFSRLCTNLKLNGITNTTPLPLCVSDHSGVSSWVSSSSEPWTSHLGGSGSNANASVVPVCTLDQVAETLGVMGRVALIKIDVEGLEGKVLSGARRLIQASRPGILCELHGAQEARDVTTFLRSEGYRWDVVEYIDESRQHIYASFEK